MSESANNFDCAVCGLTNNDFKFYGISHCDHPICGVCAIKLTKFSKDNDNLYDYSKCVICKQHMTKIVISDTICEFERYNEKKMIPLAQYGLLFDGIRARDFYESVIGIKCQICNYRFNSVDEYKDHVGLHNSRFCDLCVQFNKCLPSEFVLMNDSDYHYHNNKEHPKCKFCVKRYYDNAHLIKHAKDSHFLCDICHRRQGFVAYNSQEELLKHFLNDHHVCEICRSANNINAFDSEYNLKTHKVLEHDNKSLVTEGLVNVNYGDTNARYGPRRRGRENEENFFNDVPLASNQPLPEMACVEEFPPLNPDSSSTAKQLGTRSLTNDENDARAAFGRKSDKQDSAKKVSTTTASEVPYSMTRSIGNLNDRDFPSLSSEVPVSSHSELGYSKLRNTQPNKDTPAPRKHLREEDFPTLAGKVASAPSATPSWKPSNKSNHTSHSARPAPNHKVATAHPPPRAREHSPVDFVDMEMEREAANKPRIQLVSREDFEHCNGRPHVTNKQPPPQDADFPALGGGARSTRASTTTKDGAWGQYAVSEQPTKSAVHKPAVADSFTSNGPLDFPELPFKPKVVDSLASSSKQKGKQKKKDNFAAAAASPHGANPKSNVYSLKSLGEQFHKAEVARPAPAEERERYVPSQPSSLRGIDYVPCVVPTNEGVIFVDSKQFADLKKPVSHEDEGPPKSRGYDADFPSVAAPCSNKFDLLRESGEGPEERKKTAPKTEAKKVPSLSSNADFPTLAVRAAVTNASRSEPSRKKKEARVPRAPETSSVEPVVLSLRDVALSVTKKTYTPFEDGDERNQALLETVSGVLEEELAQQFLALSGSYRTRRSSVQDYLEAVHATFQDQLALIADLLPQMLVLLPDISLQKCLLAHMPKPWTAALRECVLCGQIVSKTDAEAHVKIAH